MEGEEGAQGVGASGVAELDARRFVPPTLSNVATSGDVGGVGSMHTGRGVLPLQRAASSDASPSQSVVVAYALLAVENTEALLEGQRRSPSVGDAHGSCALLPLPLPLLLPLLPPPLVLPPPPARPDTTSKNSSKRERTPDTTPSSASWRSMSSYHSRSRSLPGTRWLGGWQ